MLKITSRGSGGLLACLIASLGAIGDAGALELSDLITGYRGSAIFPTVRLGGEPVEAAFEWREWKPALATSVFNHTPAELALSYSGLSFSAQQTSALGNYVRLADGPRVVDHAEVVLVTWATAAKYPGWAARDPAGYLHPVTVMLHRLESNGGVDELQLIEQATVQAHVPWRPETLPDGRPYPVNGHAFRLLVPFSAAITVPDDCLISVAYNTQSHGFAPVGSPGPYNELNVALTRAAPRTGMDHNPDVVLWVRNGVWSYPASNWASTGSPMLGLSAMNPSSAAPGLSSHGGPVDAGIYHVRATHPQGGGPLDAVFGITKAAARILPVHTRRSAADEERGVVLETDPQGLALAVSYEGAPDPPSTPGIHPYHATINDRNHEGSLDGELFLTAMRYGQWRKANPGASESGLADTDGDGVPDRVEFAVGNDPGTADPAIVPHRTEAGFEWRFRQRRWMDDVILQAEMSADMATWIPVQTEILVVDEEWETHRVTGQGPQGFLRINATTSGSR